MADRHAEEEEDGEVDEEELKAFLDAQLADVLEACQEGENQESNKYSVPASKADDALRTCKLLVKGSVHPNDYENILFLFLVCLDVIMTWWMLFWPSDDAEAGSIQPHDEQRGRGGERGDRGDEAERVDTREPRRTSCCFR